MLNSAKKLTLIATLLVSGAASAIETKDAIFVNNNTIENGAYKTITYQVCAPVPNSSHFVCEAVKSVDVKDASAAQPKVSVKLSLKAGELMSVLSAVEKDSAGREIAKSDYVMHDGEYETPHSYCDAGAHRITVFDNYNLSGESIVTCQDGIYR